MIKTLILRNFQSHKKSVIHFHPGINVIIGDRSDSGKSAIVRGLEWIFFNRLSRKSFCSWWTKKKSTSVEVTIDKDTIKRSCTKKKSGSYTLNGESFKALSGAVPPEISKAHGITDLNFQRQHDNSFLLSQSSGEVARYLNKTVNLDIIRRSQTNISQAIKVVTAKHTVARVSLSDIKERLSLYDWVEEAEGSLVSLEQKARKLKATYQQLRRLNKLIEDFKTVQTDHKTLRRVNLTVVDKDISTITVLYDRIVNNAARRAILEDYIESLEMRSKELVTIKGRLKEVEKDLPEVCPTCGRDI